MEEWIRWEPIKNLSGKYYLDNLIHSADEFIVKLSDDKQKVELYSKLFIDAYRYTNKNYQLKVSKKLSEKYGNNFYQNWTFFKVNNSEYLAWISKKSGTWSDYIGLQHYCILGSDEIIDVLALSEPIVKIIE